MPRYVTPPIQHEPLLSNAQGPGRSQRLSDSSISSYYDSMSGPQGRMPNSYSSHSISSATPLASGSQRFGPTASFHQSSPVRDNRSAPAGLGAGAGAGATGAGVALLDDDDLDDNLHTFTARDRKDLSSTFDISSARGWANALMLAFLGAAILALFGAYPVISAFQDGSLGSGSNTAGFNLGGINATGGFSVS